jgi:hypothetical protein
MEVAQGGAAIDFERLYPARPRNIPNTHLRWRTRRIWRSDRQGTGRVFSTPGLESYSKHMLLLSTLPYFGLGTGLTVCVDSDSKDRYCWTLLALAVGNGHETLVKLLLARDDVDPDSKSYSGPTPLCWASRNGHQAVVKLLQ